MILFLDIYPSEIKLHTPTEVKVHTKFWMWMFRGFIHNHQWLETIHISLTWWMYKETVAYSFKGIQLSNEKEQT